MKSEQVKYDPKTQEWCERHPAVATTIVQCEKCGLFYKPFLGHECKFKPKELIK